MLLVHVLYRASACVGWPGEDLRLDSGTYSWKACCRAVHGVMPDVQEDLWNTCSLHAGRLVDAAVAQPAL